MKNLLKTVGPVVQTTGAIVSAWQVLWESPGRKDEIALFIFPRFLEVTWGLLKRRKLVKDVPTGQVSHSIAYVTFTFCR